MNVDRDVKFWRCEKFGTKNVKCMARLHTDINNCIRKTLNHHVCDQSAAHSEAERVKTAVKRRATDTLETPAVIRAQTMQNVPTPVLAQLPNKEAMRKVVQRVRHQENAPPPAPTDVQSLRIRDDYTIYSRSDGRHELFLLSDSGPFTEPGRQSTERILIFGKESNSDWANQMRECYVDGTFTISPPLFHQARSMGFSGPLRVTDSKDKRNVRTLLSNGEGRVARFPSSTIYLDYEAAIIGAVRDEFPDCHFGGCLFHLVRNFKKRLASEGLTQRYNTDPLFAESAKMITSMAFLPIDHLTHGIMALERALPAELQPILDWFIRNYTGRPRFDGTRNPALFEPSIWNVHQRTLQGSDRTNNFSEAAHRRLQRAFGCDHPSIWTFIEKLRQNQKAVDADFAKFAMGEQPAKKRKKYKDADRRILSLVHRYIAENPVPNAGILPIQNDHPYHANYTIEFLRGISHNYEMQP